MAGIRPPLIMDSAPNSQIPPDLSLGRRYGFRLIREVTKRLGWKYKLWIPASVLLSSIFLLPPRLLQFFTEGAETVSEANAEEFIKSLVLFGVAIAACLWVAIFLTGVLREWLRLTVSNDLRRGAVHALNRTRIEKLDSSGRGDWMMRMSGDLHNAEEFLTMSIPDQIQNFTMLIGSAALFFFYSGTVALIPIFAAVALALINLFVQRRMAATLSEAREIEGDVFQSVIETFEGVRTIRSYGGEKFTFQRINVQLDLLFKTGMRIIKSMAALMGLNETSGQLVITAILSLVAFQIKGGQLTVTDALVYPFFINVFLGSAKELVASAYDWNRFFIEGGRLASVLYDEKNHVADSNTVFGEIFESQIPKVQSLTVSGLTLGFDNEKPIIDNFDFEIQSGEIVALMGPSGCGKSTLLESVAGLRSASSGDFNLGLKDGSDLCFKQASPLISAFVEQQPYLFVGTIRDNITLGNPDATDEKVWQALEEVDLATVIKGRNVGGLDEILADRGRNLSVGQQYRLALCRALVSGRPLLLMDEPFAALDDESTDRVCEAILREKNRGAGVVLATHVLPKSLDSPRLIQMQDN